MKTLRLIGCAFAILLLFAFKPSKACEYSGSNINYIKTQIEKAISQNDLNLVRYYTYKALDGIEKSKKQLDDCGCQHAAIGVEESAHLLKRAAKESTLNGSLALLGRSLENTKGSIDALDRHEEHLAKPKKDVLAMNMDHPADNIPGVQLENRYLQEKIDISLETYRESLQKVVLTVDCKEAHAFAERIYKHCEKELLKPNQTEGKKYYNLRTQQITAQALEELGNCGKNERMGR
ncbi:MAG: hypothetical protein WBN39_11680 [Flavobacteriaceae bacterium]